MGNKLFKDELSSKRGECILLFERSKLRCDQIVILLNVDLMKAANVSFDKLDFSRCWGCRTKNEFYSITINFIQTCNEYTLNAMIEYLKNISTDNDITGETIRN